MHFIKSYYHLLKYFIQKTIISFLFPNVQFVKAFLSPSSALPQSAEFSYSQFNQDKFIDQLLQSKKHGFFVDIGCNHPFLNSNSAFFELSRQWSGLCLDPIPSYSTEYHQHRPNSIFVNAAISCTDGYQKFYTLQSRRGWEDQLSSLNINNIKLRNLPIHESTVKSQRLDTLLHNYSIAPNAIDILFIDVEGHELQVLESLSEYRPKIILVENIFPFFGSSKLRRLLIDLNYSFKYRIWSTDDVFIYQQ